MTSMTRFSPGHEVGYPWGSRGGGKQDAERAGGERTAGGYYMNAAQKGEAPGRWFGRGAETLGFAAGQEVEYDPYMAVYQQKHPETGEQLGRRPPKYEDKDAQLGRLLEAEPHATAERRRDLEREIERSTRAAHPYLDATLSFSKSVSVVHASIRENARRAELAGDTRAAAHWDALDARFCEGMQAANRAMLEHLQRWAVVRTGYHGARVDGWEPGRHESAGLVVTSWLQGTSRDGDPHDHVHNAIARMARTDRDGKWRAVDTMALREAKPAAHGIAEAHFQSFLVREMGLELTPGQSGCGPEVQGVTAEQMEAYSSRTQAVDRRKAELAADFERKYERTPNRAELKHLHRIAQYQTRNGKEDAGVDYRKEAAHWDAKLGGELAQVARDVGLPAPGDAPREPRRAGAAQLDRAEEVRAMKAALARVQERKPGWSRADLVGELGEWMPAGAALLPQDEAARLAEELADRALAGEAGAVECLTAPEFPAPPPDLIRDLDGRSIYTRPGTTRYATHVQLSREQELVQRAQQTGAPCLSRETAAEFLGATLEDLEAWLREPAHAETVREMLPCGLSRAQGAVAFDALTSRRRVVVVNAPAGTGKTTLAGVIAEALRRSGVPVAGTAPSQTATNELSAAIKASAWNNAQFLGHRGEQRYAASGHAVPPAGVVIMDEASMTSIDDASGLVERTETAAAKAVMIGDVEQLTAVQGGGALRLLAQKLGYSQPPDPVRFAEAWEGSASLRLRAGDVSVLSEYEQHGRITSAPPEEAMELARRGYVADVVAGKDPLLMAYTRETCREMNMRIRDDLQHLGIVQRDGREIQVRGGLRAAAGDVVISKKVDHKTQTDPGHSLANADTFRVLEVKPSGAAALQRLLDCDRETGERRYGPAFLYGEFTEFDLAYAVTTHSQQSRTVTTSTSLANGTEDRHWLYTAMTRGRLWNRVIAMTSPAKIADTRQGTRGAPELERYERIEHERAGYGPQVPPRDQVEENAGDREAPGVIADVLAREDPETSATEYQEHSFANADHLADLYARWQGETQGAIRGRYERELRAALPEEYRDESLNATSTWLWRTLRAAEAAGLDSEQLVRDAIARKSLTGARDIAAVVDSRIREDVASLVPLGATPWSAEVPEGVERPEYVGALAEAMDARKERLGEFTAEAPPLWAVHALGSVPEDPLDRLEWERRASDVATYRELFGYEDPSEPIGPEPSGDSPEKRSAWHAAFAALGPVDGVDVRSEPDGRLLLMRQTYETETAWAPRYVGDELRQVRAGAERAAQDAARAEAEASLARERGDAEAAARHGILARSGQAMAAAYRTHEAAFADTMETREEWRRSREPQLRTAVAADSEYRRRHPEEKLEPLRSAEPAKPSEEERQAVLTPPAPDAEPEVPQWVTDLADRNRAAREKLDELRSVRVPAEDPDEEPDELAWPDQLARERDAILQPPKPEIRPAARVAELAAERETAPAAAGREAGE